MRCHCVVLFLLILFTGCQSSDPAPEIQPSLSDFSSLTPIIEQALPQLGGKAGLVMVARDGSILYKQYWGGWNDSTFIPVASGSKWPSMATILSLVEAPELDLDLEDTVVKFYPDAFSAPDRRNITLQQLMSHTAGFSGSSRWISTDAVSLQEAVSGIGQGGTLEGTTVAPAQIAYPPTGSRFAYGGVSMHVAGGIAEKVSGKSWETLFRERIGVPCRMPATNYQALGPTTNYRIAGGAGTRMMEYANFLLMLLNEGEFNGRQVLSKASVQAILSDQTRNVPIAFSPYEEDPLRKDYRYGLGCWIEGYYQGQPNEFGDQGAFGFSPWIDKARGIAGILFVQRTLRSVNLDPTPQQAPYTLIRQKVAELLPLPE